MWTVMNPVVLWRGDRIAAVRDRLTERDKLIQEHLKAKNYTLPVNVAGGYLGGITIEQDFLRRGRAWLAHCCGMRMWNYVWRYRFRDSRAEMKGFSAPEFRAVKMIRVCSKCGQVNL